MKKLLSILSIILLFFSSCSKDLNTDKQEPKNNLLSINIKTEGILISTMKSIDISTWIYNYNVGSYNLIFTGKNKTYTFSKSIQELKNGFSVNIAPDEYIITYQSIKQSVISSTADININQTKVIQNSGDLTLTATNSDFLIIVDLGENVEYVSYNFGSIYQFFIFTGNVFYCYSNIEKDYSFDYKITNQGFMKLTLNNTKINNIYHIIKGINGNSTLNILPFDYNVIVL